MEMHKLILLIRKLQKFNISIKFICSDGETGLTKYHTAYFEKYIYEYIPKLSSLSSLLHLLVFNGASI